MHYKGAKKSLPEIASELNVDAVVEGAVQRSGDRVSIRARLIHAAADRQLWAESYDRDLRDALGLQTKSRAPSPARFRQAHSRRTSASSQTWSVNRKALDDYLQGRYLYWKSAREGSWTKPSDISKAQSRKIRPMLRPMRDWPTVTTLSDRSSLARCRPLRQGGGRRRPQ